jgi:large subunit ribosomal protein L21
MPLDEAFVVMSGFGIGCKAEEWFGLELPVQVLSGTAASAKSEVPAASFPAVLLTGHRELKAEGAVISEFFIKKEVPDMYAIIATGGKQYKVSEGDVIDVEKIAAEAGAEVTFDNVLAVGGETLKVAGDVAGASVTGTVMEQGKAKKVVVYRYKRKTGYHKKNGHRQLFTRVKIDKINA